MGSELVMGYVVYVEGVATEVGRSLAEAKGLADKYIAKNRPLKIESAVAPAPAQVWNYDYNIRAWVERV